MQSLFSAAVLDGGKLLRSQIVQLRHSLVKALLDASADPNGYDDKGMAALHYAMAWEQVPVSTVALIAGKADLCAKNYAGVATGSD
jgi:ankyrin repeat protein